MACISNGWRSEFFSILVYLCTYATYLITTNHCAMTIMSWSYQLPYQALNHQTDPNVYSQASYTTICTRPSTPRQILILILKHHSPQSAPNPQLRQRLILILKHHSPQSTPSPQPRQILINSQALYTTICTRPSTPRQRLIINCRPSYSTSQSTTTRQILFLILKHRTPQSTTVHTKSSAKTDPNINSQAS